MTTEITTSKIKHAFEKGLDYPSYRNHIKVLLQQNKTTGDNHSEAMISYTTMNDKRMDRWDKKITLDTSFNDLVNSLPPMKWLVITEGWCGDAAQNIPFIAKIADQIGSVDLRLILRDEHTEIMDQYLTNGARSIPILVMMDQDFKELATWGPRPDEVQKMVMDAKKTPDLDQAKFIEKVHKWYATDKNKSIGNEFKKLLKSI